eukprot:736354-Prymnesium_polylepis.1
MGGMPRPADVLTLLNTLPQCPRLEALALSAWRCNVTTEMVAAFVEFLGNMPNLRTLTANMHLSEQDAKTIADAVIAHQRLDRFGKVPLGALRSGQVTNLDL